MPDEKCILGKEDPRCGSANGYTNLQCRGDGCRQAWAIYHYEHFGTEARESKLLSQGLVCKHPDCMRGQWAKITGLCKKHHARFKRTGSSWGVYGPPAESAGETTVEDVLAAPAASPEAFLQ